MDLIFGHGSIDELSSPQNGLFLHLHIESALEKGIIAIIPDIDIDTSTHPVLRKERLVAWESRKVKDYKVWVLDKTNAKVAKKLFYSEVGYPVQTIAELHNRPLKFINDHRPHARYMWWAFLNSIQQFSMRQTRDKEGVRKEVLNSTRYWGTQGRYIHENILLGFVEELGQAIDPETASIIMGNAKEGDGSVEKEADPAAVTIMASDAIIKARERYGEGEEDSDEDSDEEE